MKEIRYIEGDATQPQGPGMKYITHIVNNEGRWGAGFVVPLGRLYPEARQRYLESISLALGGVQIVTVAPELRIANMVAQKGIRPDKRGLPPIRYGALWQAMESVRSSVQTQETLGRFCSIHAPRFGSGLAGGDWKVIEAMIIEAWVDHDIEVTVYDLPGSS